MRGSLTTLLVCALALAAGCTTTPNQSTSPTNTTTPVVTTPLATTPTSTTPASVTPTTPTMVTPTPGGNATNATNASAARLTYVAAQSGASGNNTTYRLDGPSTATAGWVAVTLQNRGQEPHQAAFYRILNGTYEQVQAALLSPSNGTNGTMPRVLPSGGVALAAPGGNATTWVKLEPGTYAVLCFLPDSTGMPHAMHGMAKKLTVTNATGSPAGPPLSDATIGLMDYKFNLSANLTAGHRVLKVANDGMRNHEAVMVRLQGNQTLQQVLDAMMGGRGNNTTAAAPAIAWGAGGSAIAPGQAEYVDADLAPGRYALFCLEQDSATAQPHAALGMAMEFDVR